MYCPYWNIVNKVPIGYNGTTQIHSQNCPFPFDDHHQNLIHPFLDRPHSSYQTASRSNQPFRLNTLGGPTDRWSRQMFRTMSVLTRYADRERRANDIEVSLYHAHKLLTTILSLTNNSQEVFRPRLKFFQGGRLPTLPPCQRPWAGGRWDSYPSLGHSRRLGAKQPHLAIWNLWLCNVKYRSKVKWHASCNGVTSLMPKPAGIQHSTSSPAER